MGGPEGGGDAVCARVLREGVRSGLTTQPTGNNMLAAHGCPSNADCCNLEQSFGPPSPSWPEGAIPVIIGDRIRGVWVQGDLLQLAQGAEGAPGSQILVGTGSPASSLGAISDLYIDATSPNQFFQKTGPTT